MSTRLDPAEAPGTSAVAADREPLRPPTAVIGAGFALLVLVLSVVTVLRYTARLLQADGVQQSVMSIQDVDLFFWGQNRFAAIVSFLASPIADPNLNLWACLLINAVCFHGLLLTLSFMGAGAVTGERRWTSVLAVFLTLVAVTHVVLTPATLHIMALESQPYSMSYLLTLLAYLAWRRSEWWSFAAAVGLVGVAVGLNPAAVLLAAFLAVVEMVRRKQWIRWPAFGVVWIAWFVVWLWLAERLGGTNDGPVPDTEFDYLAFSITQYGAGAGDSAASLFARLRPIPFVVVLAVACVALLVLPAVRRAALFPRLAWTLLFSLGYWAVFTGNPWVALNGYVFRYFYPVLIALVLCLAAPIAGALTTASVPGRRALPRMAVLGATAAACVVALAGPLATPASADVFARVRDTADFAKANDVSFISGYYWTMWPLQWLLLDGGRDAAFVAGYKSGGDADGYRLALERELAEGDGPPRAICVNEQVSWCQTYLDFWTAPGWQEVPGECPSPDLESPPVRQCRILEFAAPAAS